MPNQGLMEKHRREVSFQTGFQPTWKNHYKFRCNKP